MLALLVARVVREVGLGEHAERDLLLLGRLHELDGLAVAHAGDVGRHDGDDDGRVVAKVALAQRARARHHVGRLALNRRGDDAREVDQVERRHRRLAHLNGELLVDDAVPGRHHLGHELPDGRGSVRFGDDEVDPAWKL